MHPQSGRRLGPYESPAITQKMTITTGNGEIWKGRMKYKLEFTMDGKRVHRDGELHLFD